MPALSLDRGDPLDPPGPCAHYREAGIHKVRIPTGYDAWLVSRHDDIRSVAADKRISSFLHGLGTVSHERLPRRGDADVPHITNLDGADHLRLRMPVARHFTARRVRQLEEAITAMTHECLVDLERSGPGTDLVRTVGMRVPSFTICALFGLPRADQEMFERLAMTALGGFADSRAEQQRAAPELFTYLAEVVERKKQAPDDALFSDLVHGGHGLSDQEILTLIGTLLVAGYDTTAHMISLGVYAMLRDRPQWEALVQDPALADLAVEELLRYLTVMQRGLLRRANEDLTFDGVDIRKDDLVLLHLPAGNHDPDFVPLPDQLDITRPPGRHLAFGYGPHQCIGQQLARMELRVVYRELAVRFPTLRMAHAEEETSFRSEHVVYGLEKLPVTW
ncbi:cytochrome P450 [Streptomyces sp. BHT-5-2]|uniref:cytochrome P450 n=1 Tax=Streptomyces sp. BHT-5-2 TaxID=2866715 RepID=UPI001C8EE937|nr:cytochrome P450 [Streptomyces sp. BHT-5-2]QZL06391.1 cytochrome P450 [Streptomyces sp. BHT-5-2]